MELRQLKYFVKTAETLNFSEAAKVLFITQSTLSQQIRQLENELGIPLFQRNSHVVALTEAGEELLPHALKTLRAADSCFDRMRDLRTLLTGTLNIGVTFTFSPILTETLLLFMKKYPEVKLNIYYKTMEELMEMLGKREVDFVLAFKPTRKYEEIESHILFDNHLSAIVSDRHPLASRKSVSLAELKQYHLALPSKGLQARNTFDTILSRTDHQFKVRIELNEVNILLKLIRESNLVTILSEATIHNEDGVRAVPLDVPDYEMEGCIHALRNAYRKHSALEFIRMLSESNAIKERIRQWI
ncbi:MAG: LysR substrate-binding domain-containing protein [Bacteroides sp.]|nr:LysR substrate-binding domain-containing protein [Roseburia sp.]MCM1346674.1 LysR substrate-binding domain-containing protein [Bacteroides sp.]MCM1422142.1 LysR substrate-binding domain-containing protein [Bacteroides sp.]